MPNQNALIYLRVSSAGQAAKENPIETQREVCLDYARHNNYSVNESTDIYTDGGFTGRNGNRLAFKLMTQRLLSDDRLSSVISYDISRIFRDGVEFFNFEENLHKHHKSFVSVTERLDDTSPAGWFMKWMLAGTHEFRSRQDGVKIRDGMINKARSGMYPGFAPFGYKNVREMIGTKDKRWIETNEIEAPWVTEAFREYATGLYSLKSLADQLTAKGFPARKGGILSPGELEKILKRKTYIGWISWCDVECEGNQDKLIDFDTFNKVQALMTARNFGANKKRKFSFMLRGLAYCGECHSRWTAAYHKGKTKTYPLYSCQKRQGHDRVACTQPYVAVDLLEKDFAQLLKKVQIPNSAAEKIREKIKEIIGNERQVHDSMAKSIQISLDNAENRKRNLLDKYIDKKVSDEDYESYNKQITDNISNYKNELSKIDGDIAKVNRVIEVAVGLANNCYRAFQKANHDEKTILAQAMFERIIIKDKQIVEARLNEPLSFVCKTKIEGLPLFKYDTSGGSVGS